jgi:hypothetical protein
MPRLAPLVPAESDILCERCGYTLNGLPESGNCPECGEAIAKSTVDAGRERCAWDLSRTRQAFINTSAATIFRPTKFFRTLAMRGDVTTARDFARIYWLFSAILFGFAAALHAQWYWGFNTGQRLNIVLKFALPAVLIALTYVTLDLVTSLAAKLTNWEASYRGLRMPITSVLRGMYYHAAHYFPVALLAFITVFGFVELSLYGVLGPAHATKYLYVLCIEVLLGAGYLFHTYWIAMRNMMYANR